MSTSKWIVQCPIIIELSDGIESIKEQECNSISKSKKNFWSLSHDWHFNQTTPIQNHQWVRTLSNNLTKKSAKRANQPVSLVKLSVMVTDIRSLFFYLSLTIFPVVYNEADWRTVTVIGRNEWTDGKVERNKQHMDRAMAAETNG